MGQKNRDSLDISKPTLKNLSVLYSLSNIMQIKTYFRKIEYLLIVKTVDENQKFYLEIDPSETFCLKEKSFR